MGYATDWTDSWVGPVKYMPRQEARKQALDLLAPLVEVRLRPYLTSCSPRALERAVRKHLRIVISDISTPSSDRIENRIRAGWAYCQNSVECPIPVAIVSKYPEHQLIAYRKLAYALSFVVDDILMELGKSDETGGIRDGIAPSILIALLRDEDVLYYISTSFRGIEAAVEHVVDILEAQISPRH